MRARKGDDETKKRIEELEKEIQILKCARPAIVADDPYELLLMCDLFSMDQKLIEAIEATPFKITNRPVADYTFKRLLDQFPARTVREQKDKLRHFLHEHPALRTMNIQLLLQRVYMWKHYHELFEQRTFPQNAIKETVDSAPIEEPPELPEE